MLWGRFSFGREAKLNRKYIPARIVHGAGVPADQDIPAVISAAADHVKLTE